MEEWTPDEMEEFKRLMGLLEAKVINPVPVPAYQDYLYYGEGGPEYRVQYYGIQPFDLELPKAYLPKFKWEPMPPHRYFNPPRPDKHYPPDWLDLRDYQYPRRGHEFFNEWAEELDREHWLNGLREKWGLVEGTPQIERDYGLGDAFNDFAKRYVS